MDFDPRNAAQRRAGRIALFRQELAELEQEEALRLTPEQRSGMEAHHARVLTALERRFGVDTTDSAKRISWFTGDYWLSFMEHAQYLLPAAAAAYALPWAIPHRRRGNFDAVYRLCGAFAGLFGLLVFSMSDAYCCSILGPDGLEVTCQILGVLLSAAVVAHGVRLGQGGLVNLGSVAFVVFLYVRLHAWLWDWLPKYTFFFLLGLIAFGLLLVFWRLRYRLTQGGSAS